MREKAFGVVSILLVAFAIPSHLFAFTLISNGGKPAHWKNGQVSYYMNSNPSGYFTGGHDASGTATDEFQPIREAFNTWRTVSGLGLSITELGTTNQAASSSDDKNYVGWITTGWSSLSFRPPSNALAVTLLSFDSGTGEIVDADIYFNAENFHWAVVDADSETSSYVDVKNIATHEIGHLLGMDHSSEKFFEDDRDLSEATMYYASHSGEIERRALKQDDLNGINSLYGASARATATLSSAAQTGGSFGTVDFQIHGGNFGSQTSFVLTKNDTDCSDAVARYRTINNDSNATATFEISSCLVGDVKLVAFNNATALSSVDVHVEASGLSATSTGGGGGCSLALSASEQSSPAFMTLILGLLSVATALLFSMRQTVQVRMQAKTSRAQKN